MSPEEREKRDRRAIAVAELLRSGWSPRAVSAGVKAIDAGSSPEGAMEAMQNAQAEESQ